MTTINQEITRIRDESERRINALPGITAPVSLIIKINDDDYVHNVIKAIEAVFGLGIDDLKSPSRTTKHFQARMCLTYFLRKSNVNIKYTKIGLMMNRHYSTAVKMHKRVIGYIDIGDPLTTCQIKLINDLLKQKS